MYAVSLMHIPPPPPILTRVRTQGVARTLRDAALGPEEASLRRAYVAEAAGKLAQEEGAFIQGGGLGLGEKAVRGLSHTLAVFSLSICVRSWAIARLDIEISN